MYLRQLLLFDRVSLSNEFVARSLMTPCQREILRSECSTFRIFFSFFLRDKIPFSSLL